MKRILFVINSLDGGGAEKSLISLLCELEKFQNQYKIDLLLPNKEGLFYNQLPMYVNQIAIPETLYYMANSYKRLICERKINFKWLLKKVMWSIKYKMMCKNSLGVMEQKLWEHWKKCIPDINEQEYDSVVSYLNGYSNYLVIDKVKAKRKILWIHNEYQKLGYDIKFDEYYYEKTDAIATISELCVKDFATVFPELKKKVVVLENISSGQLISKMAEEKIDLSFEEKKGVILLSIGRLVEQKNFQLAVETAEYLKNNYSDFQFVWYIMGKGPLYSELDKMIREKGLEGRVVLMGAQQNPYPYIKRANVFVQTSIYEGKSIVLDEAKILAKPIVVTDYATVYDTIEHGKTGFISQQKSEEIGHAILKIVESSEIKMLLNHNLQQFKEGNSYEVERYLEVIIGNEKQLENIKN